MKLTKRPRALTFLVSVMAFAGVDGCRTGADASAVAGAEPVEPVAADETTLPPYEPVSLVVPVEPETFVAAASTEAEGGALALAGDGNRYFLAMYGFQGTGPLNLPRFTHSWAYFIMAVGQDPATAPLESFTVSWDAADGDIGLFQPVEKGHNYSHKETLDLATSMGVSVRRSHVVEITKDLWDRAFAQKEKLGKGEASGKILYKMTDTVQARKAVLQGEGGGYLNCQHAVSDVRTKQDGSLLDTGTLRGWAASDKLFDWLSPFYASPDVDWDQVLGPRLGL